MRIVDWSSDVCSSDLVLLVARIPLPDGKRLRSECGDKVILPIQDLRVSLDANRRRGAGCFVPTVCDLDIRRVVVRSRALDAQEIGFGGGRCGVVVNRKKTIEQAAISVRNPPPHSYRTTPPQDSK